MTLTRIVTARDGLTIKDPRGFNVAGGVVGRALRFPLPPTTAGAARTAIGISEGWLSGAPQAWADLLETSSIAGPLPCVRPWSKNQAPGSWEAVYPAPRDALNLPTGLTWLAPSPPPSGVMGSWSNDREALATDALWRPRLDDASKPLQLATWWSRADALSWLLSPGQPREVANAWVDTMRAELRLAIDPKKSTGIAGMLYGLETTELMGKGRELGLWLRIDPGTRRAPAALWRFGGEGRHAHTQTLEADDPWAFPADQFKGIKTRHLRLLLLTPATFEAGWRPDFLSPSAAGDPVFAGTLSALPDVTFTLRAAYVGRSGALSGWDFVKQGPKASRRYVQPGAVYALEASRELAHKDLQALWLATLQTPASPDARDGFGLVVPGLWPTP